MSYSKKKLLELWVREMGIKSIVTDFTGRKIAWWLSRKIKLVGLSRLWNH